MKITAATVSAVAEHFGQPPEHIRNALRLSGVFRGAHMLTSLDTETILVQELTDVKDGKPVFTEHTKKGKLPAGVPPTLIVCAQDFGYNPLPGELLVCMGDDDQFTPCMAQRNDDLAEGVCDVAGKEGDENWRVETTLDSIYLPVFALTSAGVITQSVWQHYFSARNVTAEGAVFIADKLVELGMDMKIFLDFLTLPDAELKKNKMFRMFTGVLKHADPFHYLLTGEVTQRVAGPHSEAPPEQETPEADEEDASVVENFHTQVAELRGNAFKHLYERVCGAARVPMTSRETKAAPMRAHLRKLVTRDDQAEKYSAFLETAEA